MDHAVLIMQVLVVKFAIGIFLALLLGAVYSGEPTGQRAVYDRLSLLFFAAFNQVGVAVSVLGARLRFDS